MKWLFVMNRFPWPLTHGAYLRAFNVTRELSRQGHQVSLLSPAAPLVAISVGDSTRRVESPSGVATEGEGPPSFAQAGVTVPGDLHPPGPSAGKGRCALSPFVFDQELSRRLRRCAGQYDVVVLNMEATLQYAADARAAKVVAADLADDPLLESARLSRAAGLPQRLKDRWYALTMTRYERAFAKNVDHFVFVTVSDAESFGLRHRLASLAVVPAGVDTDYFAPAAPATQAGPDDIGPTVLFMGSFHHPPNVDAAEYLLADIAPLVWTAQPQTRFVILGPDPPPSILRLAGRRITVTGQVPDVRPHLAAATVVSVPMRTGTGAKNKLLQAWAMERPVIITSLACQGVAAQDGQNVLIADDPAAHAAAILRLIADAPFALSLGKAGRSAALAGHSWPVIARAYTQLCQGQNREVG